MKKIMTAIVALVATVSAFAQQPVGTLSVAPKAGINMAYMTDAEDGKMKLGFVAGVDLTYQMTDVFALSGGLFYSQQGVKGSDYEEGVKLDMTLKNDYFNVPVLANYYVAPGLAIKAGVQFGAILSANAEANASMGGSKIEVEQDVKDNYNSLDVAIPVGLSYEYSNFIIDARYNFGVTKSLKDIDEGSMNNVLMLTVGYKFNL